MSRVSGERWDLENNYLSPPTLLSTTAALNITCCSACRLLWLVVGLLVGWVFPPINQVEGIILPSNGNSASFNCSHVGQCPKYLYGNPALYTGMLFLRENCLVGLKKYFKKVTHFPIHKPNTNKRLLPLSSYSLLCDVCHGPLRCLLLKAFKTL